MFLWLYTGHSVKFLYSSQFHAAVPAVQLRLLAQLQLYSCAVVHISSFRSALSNFTFTGGGRKCDDCSHAAAIENCRYTPILLLIVPKCSCMAGWTFSAPRYTCSLLIGNRSVRGQWTCAVANFRFNKMFYLYTILITLSFSQLCHKGEIHIYHSSNLLCPMNLFAATSDTHVYH